MSDFLIGLDLDNVCYQWDGIARYMLRFHIRERGQVPHPALLEPSTHWNSIQEVVSSEDWQWLWSDAIHDGLYRYGHIMPGVIRGVRELSNLGDVMIVTHRPQLAVHDTLAWLSYYFDRTSLAGVAIQSNGLPKSAVEPRPHVYIDDASHVASDILANTSSYVVLFDQPHNKDFREVPRLTRAHGWAEVPAFVKAIKEAKNG